MQIDLGVKYLTLYAFSTENWKRPKDEVNALMKFISSDYLKRKLMNYIKMVLELKVYRRY